MAKVGNKAADPWIRNASRWLATMAWARVVNPKNVAAFAHNQQLTPQLAFSCVLAAGYTLMKAGETPVYRQRKLSETAWVAMDDDAIGDAVRKAVVLDIRGTCYRLDNLEAQIIAKRARAYIDMEKLHHG